MRLSNLRELIVNEFTMRAQLLGRLLDPRRDVNKECGYPDQIDADDYKALFDRGDIATRIISLYPDETWNADPEIYETEDESETEFETAWDELEERLNLYSIWHRADILSGIGHYGILLLGLGDGLNLIAPANGINERGEKAGKVTNELLYIRPFDESLLTVKTYQTDITNPRYGYPLIYNVILIDPGTQGSASVTQQNVEVHWSRIIHLADNRTNSEIYGMPRLKHVFNRVLDIRKIAGSSGEGYWKGAFPGLSLEAMPINGVFPELDIAETKKQMEAYMNKLQRYIALNGMTAKSLAPQVADPNPHVMMELKLIATALGVPWRVLIGSEQAQLASEQDSINWNRRVCRRREKYVNPYVIRPTCDRLIALGVLPEPEQILIDWPDPNTPSETQRADIAGKQTTAMASYVSSGADNLMAPFHYFTLVLGYSDDEAQSIIDAAGQQQIDDTGQVPPDDGAPIDDGTPAPRFATNGHAHGNGR